MHDFSPASKKHIADAVRIVLRTPQNNGTVKRPAFPRGGGGGDDAGEYYGQVHYTTSQLTSGWALVPLVSAPPT